METQNSIILYYYDPKTKLYVGSEEANICPKTNQPLIPWNAVLFSPLACKDGECVLINDDFSAWYVARDNRGIWYSKSNKEKIAVDDPRYDISGLTKLKPLPHSQWNDKLNCWEVDESAEQKEQEQTRQRELIEEAIYQLKNTIHLGIPHILALFSEEQQILIKDYHIALYLIIQQAKHGKYPEHLPKLEIDI